MSNSTTSSLKISSIGKRKDDDESKAPLLNNSDAVRDYRYAPRRAAPFCLPLSTKLIGSLAGGIYCRDCRGGSIHDASNSQSVLQDLPTDSQQEGDDDNHHDYNLKELAQNNSQVISPLVLAPMLHPLDPTAGKMATLERILSEYITTCKFYGCESRANAGVLTTLRFSLPSLRVSGDFHDSDMLALAEILLRYGNGPLRFIKRLDFSRSSKEGKLNGQTGFRSHGAFTLSKILQQSEYIKEVRIDGNRVGPYGASAIFLACSQNRTMKRLGMRGCRAGERGGFAFAEILQRNAENDANSRCGLLDVDLSVNRIGFRGCLAIERALLRRTKEGKENMYVDVMGNLVLQEVWILLFCYFVAYRSLNLLTNSWTFLRL